jgi:hypothetical protein
MGYKIAAKKWKIHTVGFSVVCWVLWKTRNSVCLDKKCIRSLIEIICLASSFLSYWELLENGAEALKEAQHGLQ